MKCLLKKPQKRQKNASDFTRRKYIVLNKKVGETPLFLLEKLRREEPQFSNTKLSYAGRLDPMASGALLVLVGKECKNNKKYLDLDKEYIFEILLGFSINSGDILGISKYNNCPFKTKKELGLAAKKFIGNFSFPYPAFSSKAVLGKPLHIWAREEKIDDIDIPVRNSYIYDLSFVASRAIKRGSLKKVILEKLNSLSKNASVSKNISFDFREDTVKKNWIKILDDAEHKEFQIAKFKCTVASGAYMRTLAQEIGNALGVSGLAYSIHRTKIGKYKQFPVIPSFWYKTFK